MIPIILLVINNPIPNKNINRKLIFSSIDFANIPNTIPYMMMKQYRVKLKKLNKSILISNPIPYINCHPVGPRQTINNVGEVVRPRIENPYPVGVNYNHQKIEEC